MIGRGRDEGIGEQVDGAGRSHVPVGAPVMRGDASNGAADPRGRPAVAAVDERSLFIRFGGGVPISLSGVFPGFRGGYPPDSGPLIEEPPWRMIAWDAMTRTSFAST